MNETTLKKAKAGDKKAIEELFAEAEIALYSFTLKLTANEDKAADLFQETILKGLKSLNSFQMTKPHDFISWLFRIAHNTYRDWLKKSENKNARLDEDWCNLIPNSELTPIHKLVNLEIYEALKKAEALLPPLEKEVYLLRQYVEMPFKEIAEKLNCPINSVLTRMHRAVNRLREYLNEWKDK